MLIALALASSNAQVVVQQVTVVKSSQWVQTSASAPFIDPTSVGPNYGGPYDFSVEIRGTNISSISPAPTITLPAGSLIVTQNPTLHNGGTLVYDANDSRWRYGVNANDYGGLTEAERDGAFNVGAYGMSVNGTAYTLNFSATSFRENTPSVTLTGGSWVRGVYMIDVTQALTLTTNAFTNFNKNADAAISLGVDNYASSQPVFYSANPAGDNFATLTIPANSLVAGMDYRANAGFYTVMDKSTAIATASINLAGYGRQTTFTISAYAGTLPSATLHGIGDLPGGANNSQVRDVARVNGVLYAVGYSAVNLGTPAPADTAVVWTSTGGLTALPNLVLNGVATNTVIASAITPDAAYIASRARSDGGVPNSQRHAVRVTTSSATNLDLGTLPTFTQFSAANAISDDGSVLYGWSRYESGGKIQAVRFTAAGPTVTAIPLLGGYDSSTATGRGTSSNGTVMVGTCNNSAVGTSGSGPGNAAFRYVQGVGVSAIPYLPSGTWNTAQALSPDGNLSLMGGNSPAAPNGELYLYNATTLVKTPLGTPNSSWVPDILGGMTSDGSITVTHFFDPTPSSTLGGAYLHNSRGWHNIHNLAARAGVNLTGWTLDAATGVSSDGTLVWGSGQHNGVTEGYVLEFTPGYLAAATEAGTDFNGDGKPDLVWQNTVTGDRYLWLMNGTGFSSSTYLGTIGTQWRIAAVGDFNADSKADLVWENTATGERYLWLMNGTVFTSSVNLGTIGTQWRIAGAGDFNADGKTDLVWENTATGERYLWLMNGSVFNSSVYLGVIGTQWRIAAVGDFDADGKPDLVWENTATGERYLWLMNGPVFTSSVYLGTVGTQWRIAGAGDFNADGKIDLVWENTATGERYLWLMNGTAFSSSIYLGTLATDWRIAD